MNGFRECELIENYSDLTHFYLTTEFRRANFSEAHRDFFKYWINELRVTPRETLRKCVVKKITSLLKT